jgi:dolichol-phosphate mannosyltransferase
MNRQNSNILIVIPTYNEAANIPILYRGIKALKIKNLDLLFIDDDSPDGTGKIVDSFTHRDTHVFTLHREKKSGIGSAHLAGISWAYTHQYPTLITMDSDLTHSPSYIPKLLSKRNQGDLIIASRYLAKNSMVGWSPLRTVMTLISHNVVALIFGLHQDTSNGYRLYQIENIPKNIFSLIISTSYSFFFESLYLLKINNIRISEIPIKMHERIRGKSKMKFHDIWLYIKTVNRLFMTQLFFKNRLIVK